MQEIAVRNNQLGLQVFIDGEELKYDKKSLLRFRQKVGIVFQNPDDQIFAPTVEEDATQYVGSS